MSEDKQLLGRIAHLAGQINHHKVQLPFSSGSPGPSYHSLSRLDRGPLYPTYSSVARGPQRFQSRGRINKNGPRPHHQRSLVLNSPTPTSTTALNFSASPLNVKRDIPLDEGETVEGRSLSTATWISKRDRHMQLINSSVYDKETNLRQQAIEKTRHEKSQRRNQREMVKINKHFQRIVYTTAPRATPHPASGSTPVYEVIINGLRFQVLAGGSKLLRDPGNTGLADLTPQKAVVGGVTFLRSKNGNLYRESLVRAKSRSGTTKKVDVPKVLSVPTSTTQEKSRFAPHSSKAETALQVNVAIFPMIPALNESPLVYISHVVDVRSLHAVIRTFMSDRPLPRSVAEEPSDVSSEEDDLDEIDSDDVDSEGLDEDETVVSDPQSTASVAQQHDFIGF
ncbi:hypothetical protein MMC34_008321 [Xylographa carneopallida]|nr:hypothetical protein [Xylographa carneopallida]